MVIEPWLYIQDCLDHWAARFNKTTHRLERGDFDAAVGSLKTGVYGASEVRVKSLPGAGEALGPRLAAAFGTDRQRYQSAEEIQKFSGVAPVTESSGKKRLVHWRWACPKFLRQTFHEFADASRKKSPWAQAYYQQRRQRGVSHQAAIRALAYKWIRILYPCWKTHTPYDESVYLQALRRRRSPLWLAANSPRTQEAEA